MNYQEFIPNHPLCKKYIECFWTISFSDDDEFRSTDLVLPDGGVDWVFNLGDPYMRQTKSGDKCFFESYRSQLIGQRTTAIYIKQSRQTQLVVIRFKPYGLSAMGFKETREIVDNVLKDDLLFKNLSKQICNTLTIHQPIKAALKQIEQLLVLRLQDNVPFYLSDFCNKMNQFNRVSQLCDYYGISRSTVCRDFKNHIGIGPKKMMDLMRFKSTVQSMFDQDSLTNLSYQNNYYDQAHMIHTFKSIVGMNPSTFINSGFVLPKTFSLTEN